MFYGFLKKSSFFVFLWEEAFALRPFLVICYDHSKKRFALCLLLFLLLVRWLGLSGWEEFVISLVVLDAFDYWWHRWNHRIPLLWRFHKAHHADNEIDVSTALRFHPGELLVSGGMKGIWIVLWGPSAVAWFVFEVAVSLSAQWHHANIDLPDRVESKLKHLIVTPRYHAMHHMVDRSYGDAYFSTVFSIWEIGRAHV